MEEARDVASLVEVFLLGTARNAGIPYSVRVGWSVRCRSKDQSLIPSADALSEVC